MMSTRYSVLRNDRQTVYSQDKAMNDDLWRINMELKSRRLLCDYAKHMNWSGRRLAQEAGLGHAIVLHLMKGTRTTCNRTTAEAIEDALRCPRGLLFETKVSSVSASNGRKVMSDR